MGHGWRPGPAWQRPQTEPLPTDSQPVEGWYGKPGSRGRGAPERSVRGLDLEGQCPRRQGIRRPPSTTCHQRGAPRRWSDPRSDSSAFDVAGEVSVPGHLRPSDERPASRGERRRPSCCPRIGGRSPGPVDMRCGCKRRCRTVGSALWADRGGGPVPWRSMGTLVIIRSNERSIATISGVRKSVAWPGA
jgi:hypothetical protein